MRIIHLSTTEVRRTLRATVEAVGDGESVQALREELTRRTGETFDDAEDSGGGDGKGGDDGD